MRAPEVSMAPAEERPGGASAGTVARNALFLVAGQVISTAVGLGLNAVLGRSLGPEGYGPYYLLTNTVAFAFVFVEWGQPLFVIRGVATEPRRSGELLGSSLAIRAVFGLVVMVPAAATLLGQGRRIAVLCALLALATLPFSLSQAYGMVFRGRDRMGSDAATVVVAKTLAFALALPALLLGAGIPGVIVAQGAGNAAALVAAVFLYRKLGAPAVRATMATVRELVAGGLPILTMTAAVSAQPYLDSLLLSHMVPADAMGWFGAARNILGTLVAPAVILGASFYPQLSRAALDLVAMRSAASAAMRAMLWLGALAGTGTYVFAHAAITLIYGSSGRFDPAAVVLQVFAPGLFLLFVDILLGSVVYASGGAKRFAVAKVASVAVSTALDALLIPYFQRRTGNGGIAVVVAFAASEFVVFGGALLCVKRGTFSPKILLDVGRAILCGGGTVLLFGFLPHVPLAVGIVLCVLVFALLSVALGLVRRQDVDVIRGLVRSRRGAL